MDEALDAAGKIYLRKKVSIDEKSQVRVATLHTAETVETGFRSYTKYFLHNSVLG
jgi:hypothetical protein